MGTPEGLGNWITERFFPFSHASIKAVKPLFTMASTLIFSADDCFT